MSKQLSNHNMFLIGILISMTWTLGNSFYYQQQYHQPITSPIMYADESASQPFVVINPRSDDGGYRQSQQQQQQQWINPFPYPAVEQQQAMIFGEATTNRMVHVSSGIDNLCQGGFVEHCLVQANQDGEQQDLMKHSFNNNNNNNKTNEKDILSQEFDGMCQVVIRFIDCINLHHNRCNPSSQQSQQQQSNINTDVFYKSWTNMCAGNSKIRNKYLQHSKCIKNALAFNNGQEQCQALFQSYFLSTQFSMDTIEDTVQYGCCAFNEWQYCIDSLIQKQCGPDATRAIQDLIDQASGGLVSSLCDKKIFGRKTKACLGKKNFNYNKLQTLDPQMNATIQKYISIFGDFLDRLPDDDDDDNVGSGGDQPNPQ